LRSFPLMDQGEMRNLYGGSFIDDSYKVSVQMWKLWMVWGWSCVYYNTKYWRLTATHSFKGQRSKNCSYWLFKINKFEKLICKSFNVIFYKKKKSSVETNVGSGQRGIKLKMLDWLATYWSILHVSISWSLWFLTRHTQ
jgi:hypothetical protein